MNAALMSFVSKWMGDYDNKKAKEEERSYQEKQLDKNRDYTEHQDQVQYMREKNDAFEKELQKKREALKQSTLDEVVANNRFDVAARPVYANYPGTTPEYWRNLTKGDPSNLDNAVKFHEETVAKLPVLRATNEALGLEGQIPVRKGYLSNPDELFTLGNSKRGLELSTDNANKSAADLSLVQNNARMPLAGQVAIGEQRAALSKQLFGGQDPSEALLRKDQTSYTHVDPVTGRVSIVENPYADRIHKDPLANMYGANAGLKSIAEQLGMEKYPMDFTAEGMPVQRKRPALATPSAGTKTSFSLQPAGVTYPGPEIVTQSVPRGYEAYADVLQNQPIQQAVDNVVENQNRLSYIQQMAEQARKRKQIPQVLTY